MTPPTRFDNCLGKVEEPISENHIIAALSAHSDGKNIWLVLLIWLGSHIACSAGS